MTLSGLKGRNPLAIAAFITVCIVWGTTYLGIRVAVESIPPVLLTGIRYTIGGLFLLGVLRLRGERIPMDRRTLRDITVVALLLIGGGNLALTWAEQWVPSGIAALLVATAPFWASILDALRAGGERIRLPRLAALAVGFGGVAMLVIPESAGQGHGTRFVVGALTIIGGAFAWQAGSIYGKHRLTHVAPLMSAALQAIIGGVLLDVVGLAIGEGSRFDPTTRSFVAMMYLTFFGTVIAYSAYTYALSKIPITTMSLYAYVNPIVAVILGWLILDERLTWTSIIGMVVILSGMLLVQLTRSSPPIQVAVINDTEEEENAA